MTHTQRGPWIADNGVIEVGKYTYRAHFDGIGDGKELKANAKLIAAAPEMLEALKLYKQTSPAKRATAEWHTAWYEQMTAAIKAATS